MSRFLSFLSALLICLASTSTPANTEFLITEVKSSNKFFTIIVAGTVTPGKTVSLAAQMPGRVEYLSGKEGQHFEKNALLLTLDDAALRAKIEAATASRNAAIAAHRNAQMQLNRELASPSNGSTSAPGGMGMPSMMDQMFTNPMQNMMGMRNNTVERGAGIINQETAVAQAQTQIQQAEAQIEELKASLRDSQSIAPFAGVIESLNIEVGDTVQPGQPMLSFSSVDGYKVISDVPARVLKGIRNGIKLAVLIDGHSQPVAGTVSRIYPNADPVTHTVRIEVSLPKMADITAGQYAEVSVPDVSIQQSAIAVPKSSVVIRNGLPLIFIANDAGQSELRIVRLGSESNNGLVELLSGLKEGDRVILNPTPEMRSGMQVVPVAAAQE